MAEVKKDNIQEELSDKVSESSENKKEKKAKEPVKKLQAIKPYIHIDTFLQTAVPLFELSSMQAQGFKGRMNGRHYQRDEEVFVKELKAYLNLK